MKERKKERRKERKKEKRERERKVPFLFNRRALVQGRIAELQL